MEKDQKGLGRAIINGIMKDGLLTALEAGLCVWKANAEETLEAIVEDWKENSRFCETCENHVLIDGQTDEDGIFECNDCLGPEGDE